MLRLTVVATVADPEAYDLDPLYVAANSGRWGTPGGSIYTSEDSDVCWAEVARNRPADVAAADPTGGAGLDVAGLKALGHTAIEAPFPALRLLRLDLELDRLADLTTGPARLALLRAGYTPATLAADDYGDCPAIAAVGEGLGWQALRAPSAAWHLGGSCIVVFAGGRSRVVASTPLATSARPSIYVVGATSYRAGERPAWLPPA